MNRVEGFLASAQHCRRLLPCCSAPVSWKYLYVIAACICGLLIAIALMVRYPHTQHRSATPINLARTFDMMRNPYALGFSLLIMLYVAVEVAIYVWMPTYLQQYSGSATWLATML
jgi:fucose permease